MPYTTRGSQKCYADSSAPGEGGAAEASPVGYSDDYDGSQTEIIWLDLVPGKENPADLYTKNIGNTGEFQAMNGIICGSEP